MASWSYHLDDESGRIGCFEDCLSAEVSVIVSNTDVLDGKWAEAGVECNLVTARIKGLNRTTERGMGVIDQVLELFSQR